MPLKRREKSGLRRGRDEGRWSLAIHGGAGGARADGLDARREQEVRATLARVLEAGARELAAGGSSLDVVEAAVAALEDSPLFNAGRGAVFNAHGEHELEASIMDGRDLRAGAVANVRSIKNPVVLARRVMERTQHVYLEGDGAIAFARATGLETMSPAYFWTEHRWNELKAARLRPESGRPTSEDFGTVGAVALDRHGDLAAATSTGGMTNKLAGRVGDSSVIGAGTYASNASCAVSCTGHGEYFIRTAAARDICALVEYGGEYAHAAAAQVIEHRVARLGGKGGAIVVDRRGRVSCVFNTELMYRGAVTHDTPARAAIHAGEEL